MTLRPIGSMPALHYFFTGHQFNIFAVDVIIIGSDFAADFTFDSHRRMRKRGVFFRVHQRLVNIVRRGFKYNFLMNVFGFERSHLFHLYSGAYSSKIFDIMVSFMATVACCFSSSLLPCMRSACMESPCSIIFCTTSSFVAPSATKSQPKPGITSSHFSFIILFSLR